jgi:hypothetical protein
VAVATFVPGADLAEGFYEEVIRPVLGRTNHSAALLGPGSDVLGFDTARSTDHGWGPRMHLFVDEADAAAVAARVDAAMPETYRGWPTRYGWDAVPVQHHVVVRPLGEWLQDHLGIDPRRGMRTVDWLTLPQQKLLEVIAGRVFHDGPGELSRVRSALAWYPDDVWLWLLAAQWRRLDQEEPFVGRTAEVGDALGSCILAARLARDLMRLCLLLDRRYPPYSKWLGSAFARLEIAAAVGPPLQAALVAGTFAEREAALVEAFQAVALHHNAAGVTRPVSPQVSRFHGRPFRVLGSGRFVDACLERVQDPRLRGLPVVGAVDQVGDSTDVLENVAVARRLASIYE